MRTFAEVHRDVKTLKPDVGHIMKPETHTLTYTHIHTHASISPNFVPLSQEEYQKWVQDDMRTFAEVIREVKTLKPDVGHMVELDTHIHTRAHPPTHISQPTTSFFCCRTLPRRSTRTGCRRTCALLQR